MSGDKKANRFIMQFHITGRCNLQCKHCYRTEGNIEPLSYDDIVNVIDQYENLMNRYNIEHNLDRKGQINITGGEPFIREDIFDIINYIGRHKLPFGVLTNGSFLTERAIKCLKRNKVSIVQLSIDGNCDTHDELRTNGDYKRTFDIATKLEREGIKTLISFTANKKNYKELSVVADECRKCNISKLWSDRLVPIGNGEEISELSISCNEITNYIEMLKKAQGGLLTKIF
jgi:MoaA/NifB/PqqE/SkfB family radical SAM enzyme